MSIVASCGHVLRHNSQLALIVRRPCGRETHIELHCIECAIREEIEGRAYMLQNVETGHEERK